MVSVDHPCKRVLLSWTPLWGPAPAGPVQKGPDRPVPLDTHAFFGQCSKNPQVSTAVHQCRAPSFSRRDEVRRADWPGANLSASSAAGLRPVTVRMWVVVYLTVVSRPRPSDRWLPQACVGSARAARLEARWTITRPADAATIATARSAGRTARGADCGTTVETVNAAAGHFLRDCVTGPGTSADRASMRLACESGRNVG